LRTNCARRWRLCRPRLFASVGAGKIKALQHRTWRLSSAPSCRLADDARAGHVVSQLLVLARHKQVGWSRPNAIDLVLFATAGGCARQAAWASGHALSLSRPDGDTGPRFTADGGRAIVQPNPLSAGAGRAQSNRQRLAAQPHAARTWQCSGACRGQRAGQVADNAAPAANAPPSPLSGLGSTKSPVKWRMAH
jgi:hypothetical protein